MTQLRKVETIFVATDFSKTADTAVEWAARLARPHEARIVLFHGVSAPMPPVVSPSPDSLMEEAFESDLDRARERLERTADALRRRELRAEIDLQVDLGSETILQRAETFGADLIVAGTRSRSIKKALLGSTATQLVRNASVPVLVVPPGADLPNTHMQHVLLPTDFAGSVQDTVDTVEHLLGPAGSGTDMTLLHVYSSEYDPASPWSAPLLVSRRTKRAGTSSQRLEMIANQLAHHFRTISTVTCGGDPARAIDHEAQLLGADLIVMPHGRSRIMRMLRTSTAERVLAEAPCPVLTLRREDSKAKVADLAPSSRACAAHAGVSLDA